MTIHVHLEILTVAWSRVGTKDVKVPHRRQCGEEASQIAEITTEFFFESISLALIRERNLLQTWLCECEEQGASLILWTSFVNFQIWSTIIWQTLCYQVGWRFWNPLAIQHVYWRMLTYADVSDMSDGCGVSEILLQSTTYTDVCWRMLTCLTETVLAVSLSTLTSSCTLWQARMLTYADVYGHMLTYVDVCRRLHPHQTSWDDN